MDRQILVPIDPGLAKLRLRDPRRQSWSSPFPGFHSRPRHGLRRKYLSVFSHFACRIAAHFSPVNGSGATSEGLRRTFAG